MTDESDALEEKYHAITALYDHAEELLATVESPLVKNQESQLDLVEPLINELGDATDVLAEEFVLIAEGQKHKAQSKASKSRIEAALRRLYASINDYQARAQVSGKKASGALVAIVEPIVKKIQAQVEKVVVIFLEFVQISLLHLMGKAELESLKARDPRIVALMMHQQAMAQQPGQ